MGLTRASKSELNTLSHFKWQCPVCQTALELQNQTWQCQNKHSFDRAKEGYVNLLLAQHKNSKSPGDNKEMVNARQAFLSSQAYSPLAQKIAEFCQTLVQHSQAKDKMSKPILFDIGCSEGYYSSYVQQYLQETALEIQVAGLDISKPAVQKAAKQHPQNRFAVASSYKMPLEDSSVHIALQVFAPADTAEVLRVLQADGSWLVVEPAAKHLFELKEFVYEQAVAHSIETTLPDGFALKETVLLSFKFSLNNESERLNLLKMTPYYWRISPENKMKLASHLHTVTADFTIKHFRPRVSELSNG